jgi:carbon monoxide dehydrogenase subunit G
MLRVELTIEISRPPEEVFAYLTDTEKLTRWQKSLIEARADRPFATGTRIVEKRSLFGREAESELEVTVFEPERRLTLKTLGGPVELEIDHELEANSDGTKLHVTAQGKLKGMLKLAAPAVESGARQELKRDFERLKALLEE